MATPPLLLLLLSRRQRRLHKPLRRHQLPSQPLPPPRLPQLPPPPRRRPSLRARLPPPAAPPSWLACGHSAPPRRRRRRPASSWWCCTPPRRAPPKRLPKTSRLRQSRAASGGRCAGGAASGGCEAARRADEGQHAVLPACYARLPPHRWLPVARPLPLPPHVFPPPSPPLPVHALAPQVASMNEFGFEHLNPEEAPVLVYVASSTGDGDAPDNSAKSVCCCGGGGWKGRSRVGGGLQLVEGMPRRVIRRLGKGLKRCCRCRRGLSAAPREGVLPGAGLASLPPHPSCCPPPRSAQVLRHPAAQVPPRGHAGGRCIHRLWPGRLQLHSLHVCAAEH